MSLARLLNHQTRLKAGQGAVRRPGGPPHKAKEDGSNPCEVASLIRSLLGDLRHQVPFLADTFSITRQLSRASQVLAYRSPEAPEPDLRSARGDGAVFRMSVLHIRRVDLQAGWVA